MKEKIDETGEELCEFFKNKGKIIAIKNTDKKFDIKFSNGLTFYFLFIICIVTTFAFTKFIKSLIIQESEKVEFAFEIPGGIIVGILLLYIILLCVTFYEGKKIRLKVSFVGENVIKINNKEYSLLKNDCLINVIKRKETTITSYDMLKYDFKYYLTIGIGEKRYSFWIPSKNMAEIRDFSSNFEYEYSEFNKEKAEILEKMEKEFQEFRNKSK